MPRQKKLQLNDLEYKKDTKASEFLDKSNEWRRLFAELWGTFLLVLVASGGPIVKALGGDIPKEMLVIAPGLMVMVVIYFMGTVSGAHINPAVTLAFALRSHFPW